MDRHHLVSRVCFRLASGVRVASVPFTVLRRASSPLVSGKSGRWFFEMSVLAATGDRDHLAGVVRSRKTKARHSIEQFDAFGPDLDLVSGSETTGEGSSSWHRPEERRKLATFHFLVRKTRGRFARNEKNRWW